MRRKDIMSEIENDLLTIIKALAEKVEQLESAVYHKDNLLMKSGLVVVNSPTPSMKNDTIQKSDITSMEWSDLHKMVETYGGQ